MNRAISRLFAVMVMLFAVLVAFTSRWTVFSATSLQHNPLNQLGLYASEKIKTGDLLADNGRTVLAKAVSAGGGTWKRYYPFGSLFAQPVGFSLLAAGQSAGLEQYLGSQLRGVKTGLTSVFGSLGGNQVGDDVRATLDPRAQALARKLLDTPGACGSDPVPCTGSVVAIVPQTGAIKVMYSNPTYDDNDPDKYRNDSDCAPDPFDNGCLVNLAVAGRFPPGSTFKLVTTTAALDSGKYSPDSVFNGNSPVTISGRPLQNDSNFSYGPVTLTKALTDSINTVYAPLGLSLGSKLMLEYMRRFGFYSTPPLQYPANEMRASGELDEQTQRLVTPPGPARITTTASTSGACRSDRTSWRSRRCRWRWSSRPLPTAAS